MDKKQLRAAALAKRDGLTGERRRVNSEKIIRRLMSLPCYQEADAILTYVSFRSEADTILLINCALAEGKAVFVPKVMGRDMEFFRIVSIDDLQEGYQGILEPTGSLSYSDCISQSCGPQGQEYRKEERSVSDPFYTLVCLPGAVFDRNRHRIGYGGGFYDRYLSKMMERPAGTVATVALAFDCQIFDEIPWEAHDICPACIVTESEIIL